MCDHYDHYFPEERKDINCLCPYMNCPVHKRKAKKEKSSVFGEYQLCPKCNGTGKLQPPYEIIDNNIITECDLCKGTKVLLRPLI